MRYSNAFVSLLLTALMLFSGAASAQAGTGSPSPGKAPPAQLNPPGGLYIGYYAEDPATNPEDPMLGAVVMTLPPGDAAFSGAMYFTYVGCQTENIGKVAGDKQGQTLTGAFSGTLDGRPQSGKLQAAYEASTQGYAGTFTVNGGKQYVEVDDCIEYHIAPKGSFELFPSHANVPAGFAIKVSGGEVSWPSMPSAAFALVCLLDPELLKTGRNPVVWQSLVEAGTLSVVLPARGKGRVVALVLADEQHRRIAIGTANVTHVTH